MDLVEGLEFIRVLLCFAFLIYASVSDHRKREVSNMVWVWFAPLGFALTITQFWLFESASVLRLYAFSVLATSALAILLFYAGAFGGADAKGLICLALTLPVYPEKLFFKPLFPEASPFSCFFPLMVFFNAVLMAALSVFYVLSRNLVWKIRTGRKLFEGVEHESLVKKFLTLLCSYKTRLDVLEKKKFLYPLEDFEEDESMGSRRKLLVFPVDEKREEILGRILKFMEGKPRESYVWATPGLPMMIFIFAGFLVSLFLGDLVWNLVVWIFG